MEEINLKIKYIAKDNPKCRISVNETSIHEFTADKTQEVCSFSVPEGAFDIKIEHYGKNMKKEVDKFVEIEKIFLNDIDIKNKIWDTTQVAEVPQWQDKNDYRWKGNLYLGHNAYVSYRFESPIYKFLSEYHNQDKKVSSNMESYDMDLLYEMKDYFSKIVEEQDKS